MMMMPVLLQKRPKEKNKNKTMATQLKASQPQPHQQPQPQPHWCYGHHGHQQQWHQHCHFELHCQNCGSRGKKEGEDNSKECKEEGKKMNTKAGNKKYRGSSMNPHEIDGNSNSWQVLILDIRHDEVELQLEKWH
jgi:RecJ-like exonuclease